MSQHVVLDSQAHRDLRVRTEASGALGDAVMACYAVPEEFRQLQNEFTILFRRDAESRDFSALALLGFEAGENLYLDEGGGWAARYRPLSLAIQPFLVGRSKNGEGDSQLHIDLGHPRVSLDGQGIRVFDEAGRPTAYLDAIAARLGALDEGHRSSGEFFAALERHKLIEPFALDVTLNSGAQHRMVGYHLINEDRLAALDSAALAELHGGGHLEPIYMTIASLANLSKLVERKNRSIADG
jgi:hypothetical protein